MGHSALGEEGLDRRVEWSITGLQGHQREPSGKRYKPNVTLKPDRDLAGFVRDFPFPEKGARPLPALPERDRIEGRSIRREPCSVEATTMSLSAQFHRWSDPVYALLIKILGSPPIGSWAWDVKHHPEHASNMTDPRLIGRSQERKGERKAGCYQAWEGLAESFLITG